MSELSGVINITNFQGFPQPGRNPVDNPAALRASCSEREDRCNFLADYFS
jgi:hypothetical protein